MPSGFRCRRMISSTHRRSSGLTQLNTPWRAMKSNVGRSAGMFAKSAQSTRTFCRAVAATSRSICPVCTGMKSTPCETTLRIRRRERQERAAEATAEFQKIKTLPDRGWPDALQRRDISHPGRGHEGIVAWQVGDIGDVAGGGRGRRGHGRGSSEI